MTVSIIRQYNKQNSNQSVDTSGGTEGYGRWLVVSHYRNNSGVVQDTFNGSNPTGTFTYDTVYPSGTTRTRNRISWWQNVPSGTYTWNMNDDGEATIYVLDGVISTYSYSHQCGSYEGQGVVHQQSDTLSNPYGLAIGVVTEGNGYSNSGSMTEDYYLSWYSPKSTHWHKYCTPSSSQVEYTISSDNRQGGWGVLWLRGAVIGGINPVSSTPYMMV